MGVMHPTLFWFMLLLVWDKHQNFSIKTREKHSSSSDQVRTDQSAKQNAIAAAVESCVLVMCGAHGDETLSEAKYE